MDHEVTVELKNDIHVRGTLKSVDQFLNIKLENVSVINELKYPHLVGWIPVPGCGGWRGGLEEVGEMEGQYLGQEMRLYRGIMVLRTRTNSGNRARSRASSFEVVWLGTCICLLRRWTRRYWRMLRGEVCLTFTIYTQDRSIQKLIGTNRSSTSIGEGEARMNIHECNTIG